MARATSAVVLVYVCTYMGGEFLACLVTRYCPLLDDGSESESASIVLVLWLL